ncbi:hypothetical protein KAX17_05515, partial [Candidatus Bipolaricaulota bacterium]|nr:hypothetical protein [Candidatus Bipolaricaulota bacterium]
MKLRTILTIGLVGAFIFCVSAQVLSATFTATQDGNWEDGATWDKGKVPGKGDIVIIPDGKTVTITKEEEKIIGRIENKGTLQGKDGGAAKSGVSVILFCTHDARSTNKGTIRGGNGGNSQGATNAGHGGKVRIKAHNLKNSGGIYGGNGGNVTSQPNAEGVGRGGKGGNVDLKHVSKKLENTRDGKIFGGNGGTSAKGRGGNGGDVELNEAEDAVEDEGEIDGGEHGAGGLEPGEDGGVIWLSIVPGGTLRIALDAADLSTLDPHRSATTPDRAIVDMVFNGLVRYKPGDISVFEPDLAVEIPEPSDGGRVWTFELKHGVMVHPWDGNAAYELTAEDVVYSLTKAANSDRSSYAGEYVGMSFEAVGDYTVKITLEEPLSAMLFLPKVADYAGGFIIPKVPIEAMGDDAFKTHPVGTGP